MSEIITSIDDHRLASLPDPSELEALAREYFPELSSIRDKCISRVDECLGRDPMEGTGFIPVVVPGHRGGDGFDVDSIRRDFPILSERINGKPLIWLDNAATTQKPKSVIDRLARFYMHENSNIHRGAHPLAEKATNAYEGARTKTAEFLNASSPDGIVFVRGTTEGINLVAQGYARQILEKDDEIVITWLEHHANIVPWQLLCAEKGARLRVVPVDDNGCIKLDEYGRMLGPRTKMVAVTHVSNSIGTVNPVGEMADMAHRHGVAVLVDGAQAVSHMKVDVMDLGCDFYVFSGHKVFGPTGIGVLYAPYGILEGMSPYQGGGNMISDVTFERTEYREPPHRFEAGTGNIADAVGLGAALDYAMSIGMERIHGYERGLMGYALESLRRIDGLRLIGNPAERAGAIGLVLDGMDTAEVGKALGYEGIALRAGHHCSQPALRRFGHEASLRPSIAMYNTRDEIDALATAIRGIRKNAGLPV